MVESTALEMRRARKGAVGSNPTLSASRRRSAAGAIGYGRISGRRTLGWAAAALLLTACHRATAPSRPVGDAAETGRLDALQNEVVRLTQRVTDLETRQPTTTPSYVLTTTWMTPDQPPTTTQLSFRTPLACDAARQQVLSEGDRITQQDTDEQARNATSGLNSMASPTVSATCVASIAANGPTP